MMKQFPERDWRELNRLRDTLLEEFSHRTNSELRSILAESIPEYDRFLRVGQVLESARKQICDGFDDWRRSRFELICLELDRQGLLTEERLQGFSEDLQVWFRRIKEVTSR